MTRLKNSAGYRSYYVGFAASLIFTLLAYFFVQQHVTSMHGVFSHSFLVAVIVILALAQLVVQLIFFLHLGKESKPRWNMMVFSFAVMVVGIVVFGSLWIMQHLNYHQHGVSPHDTDTFIMKDEGIQR